MFHTFTYIGIGWILTGITVMVAAMAEEIAGDVPGGWVGLSGILLLALTAIIAIIALLTSSNHRLWMAVPTALVGIVLTFVGLI